MQRGFFVAIDGPSGIGKSTITGLLAGQLKTRGCSVLATKEPTATPLGSLAASAPTTTTAGCWPA